RTRPRKQPDDRGTERGFLGRALLELTELVDRALQRPQGGGAGEGEGEDTREEAQLFDDRWRPRVVLGCRAESERRACRGRTTVRNYRDDDRRSDRVLPEPFAIRSGRHVVQLGEPDRLAGFQLRND